MGHWRNSETAHHLADAALEELSVPSDARGRQMAGILLGEAFHRVHAGRPSQPRGDETSRASSMSPSLPSSRLHRQKSGGSVVGITAALADNPIAGLPAFHPDDYQSGLNALLRSLASEYAKGSHSVQAVAPGIVDTPLHAKNPKDFSRNAVADGHHLHGRWTLRVRSST